MNNRLIACILLFAVLAGCGAPSEKEAPQDSPVSLEGFNVVVILIDSLRADHLGAYGRPGPTSPFIDTLASDAVVFGEAHAPSSFTRESVSALFTGKLPSQSGATGWAARPSGPRLGPIFREAGYATGFFSESVVVKGPAYTEGFDDFEFFDLTNADREHAPRLSERALEFAKKHAADPFLMYVHYLDPHGEYYPPAEYAARFVDQPPEVPLTLYESGEGVINVRAHRNALVARGFAPGQKDFEDWRGTYEAEIAYVDDAVRMLVEGLEALGVLDRTLLVVTSDHGEEFLEHGYVEHAWTVYRESTHVPLLLHVPRALSPARIDARISTVRILPTLLSLAGLETPAGLPRPLIEEAGGKVEAISEPGPVISENHIEFRNSSVALRDGDWTYIAWFREIPPESRHTALRIDGEKIAAGAPFPIGATPVREELFNTASDPDEQRDIAAAQPDALERMRGLLEAYREACRGAAEGAPPEGADDAAREALETLGYL
ncbi:MAG: sulfatase [Candidatus Hydrogenedentes bacterium]|nr:sulfatase [Candidatus Hydrogenedentota bacterium]